MNVLRGSLRAMRSMAIATALALPLLHSLPAMAQDKLTFLTSWYAQAEHGGFYQAVARGIYKKHGLDVTVRMGGPQVNGLQLLTAGQADFIMGYDFQALKAIEQGIPVVTVGTSFQRDLQGMLTHEDIPNLAGLKGRTILIATSGRTTWWPWLKAKYGYTDDQVRAYTFNLQPFFADRKLAQQGYLSSEPFQAERAGVKARFFLFADDGYPPYGTTIVGMQKMVKERPEVVARFVRATMEGWKSYLEDPSAGNALIKKDNPNMTDDKIAVGINLMNETGMVGGGDAAFSNDDISMIRRRTIPGLSLLKRKEQSLRFGGKRRTICKKII